MGMCPGWSERAVTGGAGGYPVPQLLLHHAVETLQIFTMVGPVRML